MPMKLMLRLLEPHWKLTLHRRSCWSSTWQASLFIPTLAAQMLNLGTSGAHPFQKLLEHRTADGRGLACLRRLRHPWRLRLRRALRPGGHRTCVWPSTINRLKLSVYDFRQFGTASITTRTISDITTIQLALTSFIQMVMPVPVIYRAGRCPDLQPGCAVRLRLALRRGGRRADAGLVHHAQRISAVPTAAEAAGPHEHDPAGKHHRRACSACLQQRSSGRKQRMDESFCRLMRSHLHQGQPAVRQPGWSVILLHQPVHRGHLLAQRRTHQQPASCRSATSLPSSSTP